MRSAILVTRDKAGAKPAVAYIENVHEAKVLFKKAVAGGKGAELWLSDGGRVKRKQPAGPAQAPVKGQKFNDGHNAAIEESAKADAAAAAKEAAKAEEQLKASMKEQQKKTTEQAKLPGAPPVTRKAAPKAPAAPKAALKAAPKLEQKGTKATKGGKNK